MKSHSRTCRPRQQTTAHNTSVSASSHPKGYIGAFPAPSEVGFHTSSGEIQEIFGRGIIRIQPHGPRHAYFLTFLPDAVDRPLSQSAPDQPSCTERATYTSSSVCAAEKGDMHEKPKARNNRSRHHKNSRKGKPGLPEEEELLLKLKRDQGLRWSTVTRLLSEQYRGRSQGSLQVYWSTDLKKRLP
ncbi:hypothetical protein BDV12DRAFT_189386 [Aspergillus spectabilis]